MDAALAESAFLKRAVEATTRMAKERGVLDQIERKLEQADVALRPAEFLFFWVAIVKLAFPFATDTAKEMLARYRRTSSSSQLLNRCSRGDEFLARLASQSDAATGENRSMPLRVD